MLKRSIVILILLLTKVAGNAQQYPHPMPAYHPSAENLAARTQFQDNKFGMFIHWGIYSQLADGEWVMHNRRIPFENYKRLADSFNPLYFDAKEWVALAKSAGMRYITITSRHHDGFSMYHSKASPYNIVDATPYKADPLKALAEECKKEGIQLNFYYSLLDWARPDYGFTKPIVDSKPAGADWSGYIAFMKEQLTELLTNYGEIGVIWLDGHWQRPTADWHYNELYSLIHKLSPKTLIGNNHHINPIAGEDIQMFERDLPGENKRGFNGELAISALPLETCETMNNSWGYSIYDQKYKTVKETIHYLVNAAGRNANFLLNVGPMASGKIQPEFTDTLKFVGSWMKRYGASIYGTRGNIIPPQQWGVLTAKDKEVFVHILNHPEGEFLFVPGVKFKVLSAATMADGASVKFKQLPEGLFIYTNKAKSDGFDTIIQLKTL